MENKNKSVVNLSDRFSVEKHIHEKIAPKYLQFDNSDNNRVGIYGYINELFSVGTNLTAYSLATVFNEIFPNTALLPESILTSASLAQISGITAKPSTLNISMTFSENDLIGTNKTISKGSYTVPRDAIIKIENFKFGFDYPIIINFIKIDDEFRYSAKYDISEKNNLSDIVDPYIPLTSFKDEKGESLITIYPTIRQIERFITYKTITSPNFLENILHSFDFKNQLAEFNVYYREPGKDKFEYIEKYLDGSIVEIGTKFCFYRLIEENKLEIIFQSRTGYFRPDFNGELKVEILSTVGKSGDFIYKGENIKIHYPDIDEENREFIKTDINIIGNSTGGKDSLPIDELQRQVCDSFSLRKTIVMKKDLYTYYNQYLKSDDTSIVRFLKFRDDVFKRMYLAYVLLKKDEIVIPTNTLEANIKNSDFDSIYDYNGVIPSGGCWKYIDGKLKYFKSPPSNTDDGFYYTNPYMLLLTKKPSIITALLDRYDVHHKINYTYINDNSFLQFISTGLKMKRNPSESKNIILSTTIVPNSKMDPNVIASFNNNTGEVILDNEYIKTYIGFYSSTDSNKTLIAYAPLTLKKIIKDEKNKDIIQLEYTLELENNNELTVNEIVIKNTLCLHHTDVKSELKLPFDNLNFKIVTAIRDNFIYNKATVDGFVIPITHKVTNTYENFSNDDIFLLQNVRDVIPIDFKANYNAGTTSWNYDLNKLPVVGYNFYNKEKWADEVNKIILSKQEILNKSKGTIVENYSVGMKFFNTYGPTNYYVIGDGYTKLDRINITLKLNIMLNRNNDINKDVLTKDIYNYIISSNASKMEPFYYSKLADYLHDKYVDIRRIEFLGINDYDTYKQSIESIEYNDGEVLEAGYVPEFINFNLIEDINGKLKPDISIIFK